MDMSSMDMSSMDSSATNSSMHMTMVFHASINDPVLTTQFTPTSAGQYAGAIIFILVLAIVFRGLLVINSRLKSYYLRKEALRRIVVANIAEEEEEDNVESENEADSDGELEEEPETKIMAMAPDGNDNKVERSHARMKVRPWRLSVDLPLALVQVAIAGVGYLLMFIVMTMNIGYFVAMLVGFFIGELFLARYGGEARLLTG